MAQALISNFFTRIVTITNGTSLSNAADCSGAILVGIGMPTAWTTANLTFVLIDGEGTARNVYNESGTEVTFTADAGRHIVLTGSAPALGGVSQIRVRSGTSATPVNQAADRKLLLVFGVVNP